MSTRLATQQTTLAREMSLPSSTYHTEQIADIKNHYQMRITGFLHKSAGMPRGNNNYLWPYFDIWLCRKRHWVYRRFYSLAISVPSGRSSIRYITWACESLLLAGWGLVISRLIDTEIHWIQLCYDQSSLILKRKIIESKECMTIT